MPPLKIGLIGCGQVAQAIHLKALNALPGVELTALAEVHAGRLAAAQSLAPRAAACADYRDLLSTQPVEAVVICLPTNLHAAAAEAAFGAGKHVYLEKPLAVSLEEGRRVLAAWQQSGRAGMIGYNYRFHPLLAALRRDLQAGRIGPPAGAQTVFATAGGARTGWRGARATGGGALLDLASHHIDLARWLFGAEIVQVFASVRSLDGDQDTVTLHLRLAGGLDVQSFASHSAVEDDCITVYGPRGKLRVDRYRGLDVEYTPPYPRNVYLKRLVGAIGALRRLPYVRQKMRAPGSEPSHPAALAHFVGAVQSGRPPSPDLLDGYRALAVVAAAEQSAQTGFLVTPDAPGVLP